MTNQKWEKKLMILTLLHYFFDLTSFYRLRQKYKNIFVRFLVQMKTLKFAFEIYWPLVHHCCSYCLLTIKRLLIFHLSTSLASRDERKKGLELHKQHVKQIHKRGKWSKAEFLSSGTFHDSFHLYSRYLVHFLVF